MKKINHFESDVGGQLLLEEEDYLDKILGRKKDNYKMMSNQFIASRLKDQSFEALAE